MSIKDWAEILGIACFSTALLLGCVWMTLDCMYHPLDLLYLLALVVIMYLLCRMWCRK